VLDDYLDATLHIPSFEVPPEARPPFSAVRPDACPYAGDDDAPPTERTPNLFSATTRRSPAIVRDREQQRCVYAIWAIAVALMVTLALLVHRGSAARDAAAAGAPARATAAQPAAQGAPTRP
jgi:hypothetical protein